jgi:hypothetical protein
MQSLMARGRTFVPLPDQVDFISLIRDGNGPTLRELAELSRHPEVRKIIRDVVENPFVLSASLGAYPGRYGPHTPHGLVPGRSLIDKHAFRDRTRLSILDGGTITQELADTVTGAQRQGTRGRAFIYFDRILPSELMILKDSSVVFSPDPRTAIVVGGLPFRQSFTYALSPILGHAEHYAQVYDGWDDRVGPLAFSFDTKATGINMYTSPDSRRFGRVVAEE